MIRRAGITIEADTGVEDPDWWIDLWTLPIPIVIGTGDIINSRGGIRAPAPANH